MFKIHRLPKYYQDWFQVMQVHTSFANIASILGLFFIIIFWVLAQICFLHVILSINSIIIIGFFYTGLLFPTAYAGNMHLF